MKKLLKLLTVLTVSSTISLNVVACSCTQTKTPTYDSIAAGLQSLKLNSYVAQNSDVDDVIKNMTFDILTGLLKLKFTDNVNIKYISFNNVIKILGIEEIIKSDGSFLINDDLKSTKSLSIKIFLNFNSKILELKNFSTLNIINDNKTDQAVTEYINNFNYSTVFNNQNLQFFAGYNLDTFIELFVKELLFRSYGSYFAAIANQKNLIYNNVINIDTNQILNQTHLNQAGKLSLKINYDYGTIKNQTFSFQLNTEKVNLNKIDAIEYQPIIVPVTNPASLTTDDVITINQAIITAFSKSPITIFFDWQLLRDFTITKTEKAVFVGANFSVEKNVIFDTVATVTSKILAGTWINQAITVLATVKT